MEHNTLQYSAIQLKDQKKSSWRQEMRQESTHVAQYPAIVFARAHS
jgi:hypothetical protein